MYRLHVYNPEHDIALGKNTRNFTPPKAAAMTRRAYGHFPAFWAADGDWILVDDVQHAQRMLAAETRRHADVKFVCWKDLGNISSGQLPSEILPWGWDGLLVGRLLRANPLFSALVPSQEQLDTIRRLSSREFAADAVLPLLTDLTPHFIGEAHPARSMEELETVIETTGKHGVDGRVVLKSPWSCSGRGVRVVSGNVTESLRGWCRNILAEQHLVMVEPFFDKVCDFAMEFMSDKTEGTTYLGLNLFDTNNGAFTGNVAGTEADKCARLGKLVDVRLLDLVRQTISDITSKEFHGRYAGPFGVDMMIVRDGREMKIHPCVELNLRRTMGHAAL